MRITTVLAFALVVAVAVSGEEPPFAPSQLRTTSGKPLDPDGFFAAEDCAECHKAQYEDWKGSLHAYAHDDAIYLAFAELARKEGGEELYRFCSGCHAPAAVATGEIPSGKERTFLTDEGVTCDVCHRVKEVRTIHAGGGANASLLLEAGEARYGPLKDAAPNPVHGSVYSEAHTKAEFCSACHTLVHPHNGLVIENTYAEWKASPYAAAGIQCQDCHMRTVAQAIEVARTMKPVRVPGKAADDSDPRPDVFGHIFAGASVNGAIVGIDDAHVEQSVQRLKSAATLALGLPEAAVRKGEAEISVTVENVGAGHAIPTSITELRQVWIDLSVADAEGSEVFRSGAIDERGKVDPNAAMFHSVLVDEGGKVTYLPWRAVRIVEEKLIPPKGKATERYSVQVPEGAKGPLQVRAVLRYRSAPQEVLDELFGKGKFPLRVVDMAEATGRLPVR